MTAEVREMLGSEVLLHGSIEQPDYAAGEKAVSLSAKLPTSCKADVGDKVRLYVDMSRIKLFDVDTEENILYV